MNACGCGAQDNSRQMPDNIRQKRSFLASTWVGYSACRPSQREPPLSKDPLFSTASAIGAYVESGSNLRLTSPAQRLLRIECRLPF